MCDKIYLVVKMFPTISTGNKVNPHQLFEHFLVTHNNDDLTRLPESLSLDSRHSSSDYLP